MAHILDHICDDGPVLDVDDWPRSTTLTEWFHLTRDLIQRIIADMDLDPDSLSQVEEALILQDRCKSRLGSCTLYAVMAINHRHHSISLISL